MRAPLRAIGMLLALAAWASTARADSGASVAVVIDSGNTDLFVESLVRATLESELVRSGHPIPADAPVGGEIPARLSACAANDASCARGVIGAMGVSQVILLRLSTGPAGDEARLRLAMAAVLFDTATGKTAQSASVDCENCQDDAAMTAACLKLVESLYAPPAELTQPPVTSPPDVAPVAPVSAPSTRPPVVDPAQPRPLSPPRRRTRIWPVVALSAGLMALGTGTTLIAIDGPRIADGLRQREQRDTARAGFATLGIGVVLVGASAYLWTREADETEGLAVVPVEGGAALTWQAEL